MREGPRRAYLNLSLLVIGSITDMSIALPVWAALPDTVRVILQKGRQYSPADLFLQRGDTLIFVNGDDVAVHHAFIEADRFTFDGGDQEPGTNRALKLTEAGDFVIRCGIHPKMKLTIHVQ